MTRLVFRSSMPAGPEDLYAWHARGGAFERLVPPWQDVRVVRRQGGIEAGAELELRIAAGPLRLRWVAEHLDAIAGREFTDVQRHGPFARWQHRHRFLDGGDAGNAAGQLSDEIEYRLPLEPFSRWTAGGAVRRDLERMFAYRHERTRRDLLRHAVAPRRGLRVAVTGSTGMIGSALCAFLTTGGHEVVRLVRRPARPRIDGTTEARWDPSEGKLDPSVLEGVDAVVHLAGAPVAASRWTESRRQQIRDSRVASTRLLATRMADVSDGPRVLVTASGTGFYGDRDGTVDEGDAAGRGFLARTAVEWESAAAAAEQAGVRVVRLRLGVVIGAAAGLVARLLPIYRLGLGGPVGGGEQPVSWISLDDAVGVIHSSLQDDRLEGPVNAVAPNPVSQKEFARSLGETLRRPAVLPVPAALVRWATGRMGEALVLGGVRVRPRRLMEVGFAHVDRTLGDALALELGRERLAPESS